MKIALAQMNPIIGDIKGNKDRILSYLEQARLEHADLVVYPELALTGWPPKDLLLDRDFVFAAEDALQEILPYTLGIGMLLGTVTSEPNTAELFNSAVLIEDGSVIGKVDKAQLQNRFLFDETNYFTPSLSIHGNEMDFRGFKIAVTIGSELVGEDIKKDQPARSIPELIINLTAAPYQYQISENRQSFLSGIAAASHTALLSVNQVGGNDELVFDGTSMAFDKNGNLVCLGAQFEEQLLVFDNLAVYPALPYPEEDISTIYGALILGVKDYFAKTGFQKGVLGLSGGVDSALVACLVADALGNKNVLAVSMPSRYSSDHSRGDARQLAENLGIECRVLPIEELFAGYIHLMNGKAETLGDLAEENIQARIRGNLLMFISNREGHIVVNTDNKSEAAMGYSTLYGDTCGSLSPLGDIPKTMVYQLCDYINRDREVIPVNTLTKPPSAELKPNQTDQDSLPEYSLLDEILQLYLEEGLSGTEIIQQGYEKKLVFNILRRINGAEFKRRQVPPVLLITSRELRRGGSMPMIQRFHSQAFSLYII